MRVISRDRNAAQPDLSSELTAHCLRDLHTTPNLVIASTPTALRIEPSAAALEACVKM